MCPKLQRHSGRKYRQEVKTHLLTGDHLLPLRAHKDWEEKDLHTTQRLSTPDFTSSCSGSHWEEEAGVRKMGISVPLLLVRASVAAVVTGLKRASYSSALARHRYSAQERLEQGFPQPF